MNKIRTVAVTVIAAGLATTACSGGDGRTPTTIVTVAPAPAPSPTSPPSDELPPLPLSAPFDIDATSADDPTGTPVQFALLYLNDLRAGRWSEALDEMSYVERAAVDLNDAAALVGGDVLRNASGDTGGLAGCTSGQQFAPDAVIVHCGRAHVVVHVETSPGFRGVKVSAVFVAGDHPGQPHTHAYTRLI